MNSKYQIYDNRNFALSGTYDTAITSKYIANVETCKQYCDSFDECNGFSHDQMQQKCVFYGPRRSINLDLHYGHMASYLKTCRKLPIQERISQSKTIIETLLKSFEKSNTQKLNENRKILESVDSKSYNGFNDAVVNPSVNYERNNVVLNVEYKDAAPVKNYSSITAIDADADVLIDTINTSWVDYAKVQEAHDILTTIYDDLPQEDAEEYNTEIVNNFKSSKMVILQASMLLETLREYKKVLMVKQLFTKMQNELIKYANDLAVTVEAINNTSIPQVINAKKSRAQESFDFIINQLELFRNIQGIALSINHSKVPSRDITIINNYNKTIVNKFTSSITNASKNDIHSGVKFDYTMASDDARLNKTNIRKEDTFVDFSKNGKQSVSEEVLNEVLVPTATNDTGFTIMTNLPPSTPETPRPIPKPERTVIQPQQGIIKETPQVINPEDILAKKCEKEANEICDLLLPLSLAAILISFIVYKNMTKNNNDNN
jgi:hypothetical protein